MPDRINVAILEDHPMIVEGYISKIIKTPEIAIVAVAEVANEIEVVISNQHVDVLILDVTVPTSKTNRNPYPILNLIPKLLDNNPELNILVISMHADRKLIKAIMESGASGYILKDDSGSNIILGEIIIAIASGKIYFSSEAHSLYKNAITEDNVKHHLNMQQVEILSIIASKPDIKIQTLAEKMHISTLEARILLGSIYVKLMVNDRISAISKAKREGYLPVEPGFTRNELNAFSVLFKSNVLWLALFFLILIFFILIKYLD